MTSRGTFSDRGFTLIEVIIVVALIAIIAGFGMSFSMSSIARSSAVAERDLYVSLLTQARAKALANVDESPYGVHIDTVNEVYITYKGVSESTGTEKQEIPVVSDVTFEGPTDVSFGQLSARVANSTHQGTTTISFAGQEYTVNVNGVGRIDW